MEGAGASLPPPTIHNSLPRFTSSPPLGTSIYTFSAQGSPPTMVTGGTRPTVQSTLPSLMGTMGPQTKSSTRGWLHLQHGVPGKGAESSMAHVECQLCPRGVSSLGASHRESLTLPKSKPHLPAPKETSRPAAPLSQLPPGDSLNQVENWEHGILERLQERCREALRQRPRQPILARDFRAGLREPGPHRASW